MSQGEFNVDLRLPAGTPLEATDRAVVAAQRASAGLGNVALAYSVAGTGNRLDANPVDAGENTGRLSASRSRPARVAPTRKRRWRACAGASRVCPACSTSSAARACLRSSTPLEVVVSGYDLDRLRDAAEQVRLRMQADAALRRRQVDGRGRQSRDPDRLRPGARHPARAGRARHRRSRRQQRARRSRHALHAASTRRSTCWCAASTRARRRSRKSATSSSTPAATFPVPLSAVADVQLAVGPAEVRRIGQERVAVVSANLAQGDLGAAVDALEAIVDDVQLPVGTTAFLSGQSEDMTDSLPLAAVRAAARDLPRLPRDGVAVRVAGPPLRDPAHHPARDHRRGLGAVAHGHDGQRRRVHRAHHAGRHRRQPVDRADRRRQPGARARPAEARGHHRGRPAAPATRS